MSDLKRVFWRVWKGSGDYNDAGTWTPTRTLLLFVQPPAGRSVRVKRVARALAGVVTVQALGADGSRGPFARAVLPAAR